MTKLCAIYGHRLTGCSICVSIQLTRCDKVNAGSIHDSPVSYRGDG